MEAQAISRVDHSQELAYQPSISAQMLVNLR
jgi:hypothetical protein